MACSLLQDVSENYGFAFVHYEAWDVLKNHHKWRGVKSVVPGRRVCTAKDIEEPNELFRGDTIPRLPDKSRPTKSQKSDSSRSAGSSSTGGETFKEMGMRLEDAANIKKLKDEIRAKYFGSS
ncbi:hypothetical protein Tco_1077150 [Tanacetum coccineum]